MPAHNIVEGALQRDDIQWAFEPHGQRDVVEWLAGFHLLQKPQPFLGERERNGVEVRGLLPLPIRPPRFHRGWGEGWGEGQRRVHFPSVPPAFESRLASFVPRPSTLLNLLGQSGYGRRFKQLGDRQFRLTSAPHAGHHLRRR